MTHLSVGGDVVCGLNAKGEAVCWSRAESGSIADGVCGHGKFHELPKVVPALGNMRSFGLGACHGCSVDGAGAAWC